MLSILIFFPLLIAILLLNFKRSGVKVFSVIASFLILALNLQIFYDFLNGVDFSYKLNLGFLGIFSYNIGVSFTSLILSLLCSLMIFLSFLFLRSIPKGVASAIFFLEFAIMGLFSSLDVLLFYVFWEFSLLPLIFIIGIYSKEYKIGIKFFIYAFAGSILMLVAMIYMAYLNYKLLNIFTFDLQIWLHNVSAFELNEQIPIFLAFFLAFAIKAPIFPFHSWAPKVYSKSPILVSVMLVAFKMSPFGFLLLALPLFPDAAVFFMPFIATLCIISIIYAAFIAFRSDDLKELIAYSSISHLGVMILGLFSFNEVGISGAVFYMFAHGIVTAGLFLMAEKIATNYGTTRLSSLHSLAKNSPLFSIFFAILLLASISMPLTISFVGEFLVLLGVAKISLLGAFLAGLVIILSAIYSLFMFRKVFFMQKESALSSQSLSLSKGEFASLSIIVILIFALGIYPKPFLDPIQKDSAQLLDTMKSRALSQQSFDFLYEKGE